MHCTRALKCFARRRQNLFCQLAGTQRRPPHRARSLKRNDTCTEQGSASGRRKCCSCCRSLQEGALVLAETGQPHNDVAETTGQDVLGRDEQVVKVIDLFRGLRRQRITIVPKVTGMRRTVQFWCVCVPRVDAETTLEERLTNEIHEFAIVNGTGEIHEHSQQHVGGHEHAEVSGDCQTRTSRKARDCVRERLVQTKSDAHVWTRVLTKNFR